MPLRPVRTEPCRATALGDQRSDGPVDRRAAGIALLEVGNDDFERVEVGEVPPHAARSGLPVAGGALGLGLARVIELAVHGFGHQRIDRAGRRVDEARPAAQEKAVPEKDAEEIDRRVEHELERRRLFAAPYALFRLETGVGDFLLHLLIERQAAFVPEETSPGNWGLAVGDEAFVDEEGRIEMGAAAADEAQHQFRPRPQGDRTGAPVKGERAPQLPAGDGRRRGDQLRQRFAQFSVEPFVGVDAEHPRLARLIERELLLRGVAEPGLADEPDRQALARETLDDRQRAVGRAGIDDHDFRQPLKARQALADAGFLVLADDRGGDRQRGGKRGQLRFQRVRAVRHAWLFDCPRG